MLECAAVDCDVAWIYRAAQFIHRPLSGSSREVKLDRSRLLSQSALFVHPVNVEMQTWKLASAKIRFLDSYVLYVLRSVTDGGVFAKSTVQNQLWSHLSRNTECSRFSSAPKLRVRSRDASLRMGRPVERLGSPALCRAIAIVENNRFTIGEQ